MSTSTLDRLYKLHSTALHRAGHHHQPGHHCGFKLRHKDRTHHYLHRAEKLQQAIDAIHNRQPEPFCWFPTPPPNPHNLSDRQVTAYQALILHCRRIRAAKRR